jgi:small-conductance mechanosensitive channel
VAVTTNVQVAYGTELDTLMPRLAAAACAVPRVLADPAPGVMLAGFGADGLDLQVAFWIRDPENGLGNVRSDVNLAILRALDEAGVEIPYPQRVVRQA